MRRYTVWSGDFAWEDRYVSTTVELVAMLAVPLLLRHRSALANRLDYRPHAHRRQRDHPGRVSRFLDPLEIYQMETFGHPTFVIALRFKNILAFALGKMGAWGLNTLP